MDCEKFSSNDIEYINDEWSGIRIKKDNITIDILDTASEFADIFQTKQKELEDVYIEAQQKHDHTECPEFLIVIKNGDYYTFKSPLEDLYFIDEIYNKRYIKQVKNPYKKLIDALNGKGNFNWTNSNSDSERLNKIYIGDGYATISNMLSHFKLKGILYDMFVILMKEVIKTIKKVKKVNPFKLDESWLRHNFGDTEL